ncbi:hypothetical protein ACFPOE_22370 [Caenimonas terrae]|uniref:Uncharacterized protein n=1 Tax=Caenimonas terrae TaxID=696074 RepID=A0ABW0NJV1_9BURK
MKPEPNPQRDEPPIPDKEIQQGGSRGIVTDEVLKRVVKQHPKRDEPKVDSVEPDETPP